MGTVGKILATKVLESATAHIIFLNPKNQLRLVLSRDRNSSVEIQYLGIMANVGSLRISRLGLLVPACTLNRSGAGIPSKVPGG